MAFLRPKQTLALVALSALLAVFGPIPVTHHAAAQLSPTRVLLPLVTREYDGFVPPFGITVDSLSAANAETQLGMLTDLGTKWATEYYAISWRNTQASEFADYSWSPEADRLIASFSQYNIFPLLVVGGTPDWAAEDPTLSNGPIKQEYLQQFGAFVEAAVSRYSEPPYSVKNWEIYSEPDCVTPNDGQACYAEWGDYPALYAAALQTAFAAAKKADPEAQVVSGALAYDAFTDDQTPGQHRRAFLDGFLAALSQSSGSGFPYFDVFGFNYFAIFEPNWASYGPDILGKIHALKLKFTATGIPEKPMACTECGQIGEWGDDARLEAQARYVPKLYARGLSAKMGILIWYDLHEMGPGHGLIYDDTPKPAYYAYSTMTSLLSTARYVRALSAGEVGLVGTNADAFEGYAFRNVSGTKYLWVVWLNNGAAGNILLRTGSLSVVDKFGVRSTRVAGSDGLVTIGIGDSPLYIELPSQ